MTPEEAVIYLSLGKGILGMTMSALPKETAASVGKIMEAMDYAENTFETQILIKAMSTNDNETMIKRMTEEEEDDDDAGSTDDQ